MPRLPGPLLSAVATCLIEARPRGFAPLALASEVPRIPEGLADGSAELAQDDRCSLYTFVLPLPFFTYAAPAST